MKKIAVSIVGIFALTVSILLVVEIWINNEWKLKGKIWARKTGARDAWFDYQTGGLRQFILSDTIQSPKFTGSIVGGFEIWEWPIFSRKKSPQTQMRIQYIESYNCKMQNLTQNDYSELYLIGFPNWSDGTPKVTP